MSDWGVTTLDQFIKLQRGFDLPKQQRIEGQYPVVASTSIIDTHNTYKVKGPCVTTGRSGALGHVLYTEEDCYPLNTTLWVKDFKGNNPKYVYYKLKTLGLEKYNAGAGVPTLNRNHLKTIKLQNPNRQAQDDLVQLLSSYDSLIKNNTRRIQLLEEMAQRLYNEWFVHFRFPGHEDVKMVDSETEYGEIPEGWEVCKLGEIVQIRKGKNITKATIKEGKVPVVAGGLDPAYYHNQPNTLAPVITVSASGANSGYVNIYYEAIWASDCSYIDPEVTPYIYYFYHFLKGSQDTVFRLQRGAAQPHVYPKDLANLSIINPHEELLSNFSEIVRNYHSLIGKLQARNKVLVSIRDLLISQLITGKRELKVFS